MVYNKRCSCLAITTNKKCKLPIKFNINNKKYCLIHANILFGKSTTNIQRCYKGFRVRKLLKKMYNLPDDLQRKIVWHIKESHYIQKHHHKPIYNILEKRYNKFSEKFTSTSYLSLEEIFDLYNEYINLCDLYCKYNAIIDSEKIITIYIYGKRMIFTLSNAIMNDEFNDIEKIEMFKFKEKILINIQELTNLYPYLKNYPTLF